MINTIITMLIVGGVLGTILGISSNLFYVKEDTRVAEVTELLPGYNCGGCGFPGCGGLAVALVNGEAEVALCKPMKPNSKEVLIKYLEEHKTA